MEYLKANDPFLIFIGPSAAGKSTIVNQLTEEGLIEVTPSWTTRPSRSNEFSGSVEHCFVSEEEFLLKKEAGFFLESLKMFNLPYWYGLPKIKKPAAGCVPTIILRAQLLNLAKKHFKNYKVYQIEDLKERIEKRLKEREGIGEKTGSRLYDYEKEIELGRELADRIFINTEINLLADEIKRSIFEDFKL